MPKKATLTLSGILLLVLGFLFGPEVLRGSGSTPASADRAEMPASRPAADDLSASSTSPGDARVGFTSKRALEDHFEKHGREFGSITQAAYLRLAQELRDATPGGSVREALRDDGVITRFDTRSAAFVAFHADKTIRTFFKPNDGLRYFERQLDKEH